MDIEKKRKAVARWLLLGVCMLIVQILLGGITRLTGSGLSITEWKPIIGALPPLNEQEWILAFEKYKGIAQYRYLNAHFSLSDFKAIYFWEWSHREWARLVGVVFIIGFLYFLVRKYFDKEMIIPFIILFILGAMQGLIGWIMVSSGLNDTDLYVSPIRLAIHFIAALILLCYTFWFALKLWVKEEERILDARLNKFTLFAIALLSLQMVYGAFMAGLKAAATATTWPSINGAFIPEQMHQYGEVNYPGFQAFISHPLAVQFIHRILAYTLVIILIIWTYLQQKSIKGLSAKMLSNWGWWPISLVFLQLLLGIFTVLNASHIIPGKFGTFELLAEAHQLVAMTLLVALVANFYIIRNPNNYSKIS